MDGEMIYCHNCGKKVLYEPRLEEEEGILCDLCWVEKENIERIGEVKAVLQTMTALLGQWEFERGGNIDNEELFNSLIVHSASELPETVAGFTGFMLLNKEILLRDINERE